ncbi:hypothetical protein OIU78_024548 [Salix suchowensis]|nr:hypothetical protein OIU78_024548 [Salix suchowensis]
MSRIILLMHLSSFLVAHLLITGVVSTTFTITNSCNYTVWPGVSSSGLSTTGSGGAPPATLAEFTLGGFNGLEYYNVSLVDGFNLPLLVVPSSQNCSSTGCIGDVIESCPTELEFTAGTEGKRVGCRSACDALSYVYDDKNNTYTCPSTDYQIIFCPGMSINTTSYRPNPIRNTTGVTANNSRPSSGEITPSSMPEIRPNATSRIKWEPIIAGVVGGVLAVISFVVIVVLRVMWSRSEDTEEDEEDDHIQQVPGMPGDEQSSTFNERNPWISCSRMAQSIRSRYNKS